MGFCKCAWCTNSMPTSEGGWKCRYSYCTMTGSEMERILRMVGGK